MLVLHPSEAPDDLARLSAELDRARAADIFPSLARHELARRGRLLALAGLCLFGQPALDRRLVICDLERVVRPIVGRRLRVVLGRQVDAALGLAHAGRPDLLLAINRVVRDRVAEVLQVNADLMG